MASLFPLCLRNMYFYLGPPELYPNTSTIIQGSYFSPGDFLQSSLSMTLLQWEARVPKTDLCRTILAWAMCKREKLERRKWDQLEKDQKTMGFWFKFLSGGYHHRLRSLEQEIQALEMIFHWVGHDGKEALKRAEYVLDERRVNPTHIEQHFKQLLELMEQEYWHTQPPQWPWDIVTLHKEIFKTMLKEIPILIGMHQRFGLRNFTIEARLSTTLDKILWLSSWTPSNTHNKHLRELLRSALLMLNDLGGNEEYHENLRDVMKRHIALCAFTLDNADVITEDSEKAAELCKNLRRLAQNLGKIASTKAEQYQKLYENFIAHKEDLSQWLDSASPGQGKLYILFLCIAFYI